MVNLSLIRLRTTMPDAKRGFRVPLYPWIPVFALVSCIILAFYLKSNAVLTACVFLAAGILFYYIFRRAKSAGAVPGTGGRD
jgi:APA family basic amino acid/polyamine antiporter